jgi:RimJ/RimL family protein N-acetyltransferase
LRHAFDRLGFQRVVANMAFDNLASQQVAERLGMKLESRFINPRNRDIETLLYVSETART